MWSSAAGVSRHRLTGRMAMLRQRRRGHDPTTPPSESLARLPSLGGPGNGALLQSAIPGRQSLSPGHGHPLCAGLSLLQVLLHHLSLYNALHRLFDPAFRHLHFRPQGRPQDSGRQTTSLSFPPASEFSPPPQATLFRPRRYLSDLALANEHDPDLLWLLQKARDTNDPG